MDPTQAQAVEDKNEGRKLTDAQRHTLTERINGTSLAAVAKDAKCGEQSVTKAAAGIVVQRGTIALLEKFLSK